MPVAITKPGEPGAFSLTSPPSVKGEPKLEDILLAKVMTYADRKVWVTHPFPDTLELVAHITNDLQLVPDQSGKSAKKLYAQLDEEMCGVISAPPLTEGCGVTLVKLIAPPHKNAVARFGIDYAPHQVAHFTLRRSPGTDFSTWTARLEFSPSRGGLAGLVAIEKGMELVAGILDFDKLLGAFVLARLDVAIDCIGALPLDLLARAPKEGKRVVYTQPGIGPETVYIREKTALPKLPLKKSAKTFGTLLLTLYERRAQHRQLGLPPPHGKWPVTRVEVRKRWSSKRPSFRDLGELKNPFVKRHVAYAAAVPSKQPARWREFCLDAFIGGADFAQQYPYGPARLAMAKAYRTFKGDLIDSNNWDGWTVGLAQIGIDQWIERAKSSVKISAGKSA